MKAQSGNTGVGRGGRNDLDRIRSKKSVAKANKAIKKAAAKKKGR